MAAGSEKAAAHRLGRSHSPMAAVHNAKESKD